MAHIRKALVRDIEELVAMGRRFFEASGYVDVTSFDAESFAATLATLLGGENAALMVVEKAEKLVGMAGAMVYPFYFNHDHRTGQELFWWIDPEHRGIGARLFDALQAEVKSCGAQSLTMIALETLSPERVGGFYLRRGFRPSDRTFIRSL